MTDKRHTNDSDPEDASQLNSNKEHLSTPVSRRKTLASLLGVPSLNIGQWVMGDSDGSTYSDRSTPKTSTSNRQQPTGFVDDFDYPTEKLDDNGWTVTNGTFETRDSFLLADAGIDQRHNIYHDQPQAAGSFKIRKVKNKSQFFGIRIMFISDSTRVGSGASGYFVNFRQERFGEVRFVRRDPDSREVLLMIDEDHGGEFHDVRIERDPETFEFSIYYDGELVGTVEDDTYTESSYWTMRYDGDLGNQRIDGVNTALAPEPILELRDTRAIQTVEKTRLVPAGNPEAAPKTPDFVAGRNTSVMFDLDGPESINRLPDNKTVEFKISRTKKDGTVDVSTFEPNINTLSRLVKNDSPPVEVFDNATESEKPSIFQPSPNLLEITVSFEPITINGIPIISGDSETITFDNNDTNIIDIKNRTIGFIEIADPTGGDLYGNANGQINRDFEDLVKKSKNYLQKTYPTRDIEVHMHPDKLNNKNNLTSSQDPKGRAGFINDMTSSRCALQNHFGSIFNASLAVVPNGFFEYHFGTIKGGKEPVYQRPDPSSQPQASASVLAPSGLLEFIKKSNPNIDSELSCEELTAEDSQISCEKLFRIIVAHELGHHFLPPEGSEPSPYPGVLAFRTGPGRLSEKHARTEPQNGVVDNSYLVSNAFDLSDNIFSLGGPPIEKEMDEDTEAEWKGGTESFMSRNSDDEAWIDTRAYQLMIDNKLLPVPPETRSGDSEPVLIGSGELDADGISFTRFFLRQWKPMPSNDEAEMTIEIIDYSGKLINTYQIPVGMKAVSATGGINENDIIDSVFSFSVRFPETAAKVRAYSKESETVLNPIVRVVRAPIKRLPDSAFKRAGKNQRLALNNKLDAIDQQMGKKKYRPARKKMTNDIRDKLMKWVTDDYETSALQPSKDELLVRVNETINRLEKLEEASK